MKKIALGLQSMSMQRGYNDAVYPFSETMRLIHEATGAECIPLGGGNAYKAPGLVELPSLDALMSTLRSCDLVIGVDSGILALSLALEIPCIGIFGPTQEKNIVWQFARYVDTSRVHVVRSMKSDGECQRPCSFQPERGWTIKNKCSNREHIPDCMREITPAHIATVARDMLQWLETKQIPLPVFQTITVGE